MKLFMVKILLKMANFMVLPPPLQQTTEFLPGGTQIVVEYSLVQII